MDRTRSTVIVALVGVIGVGILALIASAFVPYNVSFSATLTDIHGEGTYTRADQPPAPLPIVGSLAFPVGSTVQLEPESSATLRLEMTGGRVTLTGPATLTLVHYHRRATSLGHLTQNDRFAREYVLALRQMQGTARYDFSATVPPFEDLHITVELPDADYTPTGPCWEISVQPDGTTQAAGVDCP